jgi:hypothetical protein
MDPNHLIPGQRIIIYPKFLDKFGAVLATGNVGLHMDCGRDLVYEKVLEQRATWQPHVCPILLPEDSQHVSNWPALSQHVNKWMEDAKRIAGAGYRQVLEAAMHTASRGGKVIRSLPN